MNSGPFHEDMQKVVTQYQAMAVDPRLEVLSQRGGTTEGEGREKVQVLVKNAPCKLLVGTWNAASGPPHQYGIIDLSAVLLRTTLVYDNSSQSAQAAGKEVDFVRQAPIQCIQTTLSGKADEAELECKIKVLSTQHENMLFRIQVEALNPENQARFEPALVCYTRPIRVISKPEAAASRKAARTARKNTPGSATTTNTTVTTTTSSSL